MLKKIHALIAFFLICCIANYTLSYADEVNPSQNAFSKLGVILNDDIANSYYTWDAILVKWRVTNDNKHAFVFIVNSINKNEVSRAVKVDKNWFFQIPISFPNEIWIYYLIVGSWLSFPKDVDFIKISLSSKKESKSLLDKPARSISPIFKDDISMPYLYFWDDMWAIMNIEQNWKKYNRSWKIISLEWLPLTIWNAQVSIQWSFLANASPLNEIAWLSFFWKKNIFIDRTREIIGKELVNIRPKNSIFIMDFILRKWEKIENYYFITNSDGSVDKFYFDQSYVDKSGFLKTWVRIQQAFDIGNIWVSKIETVRSDWLAYFNIPVSKNLFWSVVPPITDRQITTLRTDKKIVDRYVLKNINIIRSKLRKPPLIIDPTLTSLAQAKAQYMLDNNDFGHIDKYGRDFVEFWKDIGILIEWQSSENIAWWTNSSDINLQDWLEESGSHRYAMISDKYKKIGIGYVLKNWKTYLVQLFGE